jgi:Fur family ferric uptake transcriptional regulator
MDRAQRMLKGAGYKLTSPRLTVLEVLEANGGHLTSTELLTLVEAKDASIGRASVFRTLDLLAKLGILATTVYGGANIRYALMTDGHHHHMICTRCGNVVEFEDCRLGFLMVMLHQEFGFSPEGHLLEVYGVCRTCAVTVQPPAEK